ncbi:hypothetical protein RRG08_037325 [Elysia crispata]|uniref:Uncharacterized protein n=1 Tax=Elysia crispata TaxID=231223 RepID=A0AAE1DZ95_9GAST|nr:hypothetical protein RRG08_037325 [Elysia crispata]
MLSNNVLRSTCCPTMFSGQHAVQQYSLVYNLSNNVLRSTFCPTMFSGQHAVQQCSQVNMLSNNVLRLGVVNTKLQVSRDLHEIKGAAL